MKSVLIFGTFDGIHPGHEFVFEQARRYGDSLSVILARDETVAKVKGRKPIRPERERLEALKQHLLVDRVVLGSLSDKYAALIEMNPRVICLGYDQEAFTDKLSDVISEHGLRSRIVRLSPFFPEKYKSSLLRADA